MKKILFLLFLSLIAILGFKTNFFSRLETSAPEIDLAKIPALIGTGSKEVEIRIKDLESGIYSTKVSLEHNGETRVVYEKRIDGKQKDLNLKLDLAKAVRKFRKNISNLEDGELSEVKTTVEARNHSFWHKKIISSKSSELDLNRPRLNILSLQHAARKGGAEFVVLEANDTNLQDVGIRIDKTIFKSVPLKQYDSEFPDSFFAVLFALPIEMKSSVIAYARDTAGNLTQKKIKLNIRSFKRPDSKINISQNFVENKVSPLYQEFSEDDFSLEDLESGKISAVSVFKTVNQDYRMQLQTRLGDLDLSSRILPKDKFVKPMAAATTSNFGESRKYYLDSNEAGGSTHDGLDLASVKRDKVLASNIGVVVLAEHFGIYGNAVVIDHGMGLTSLYGHLSKIEVSVGQEVERSEVIGRSGESGLAGGDHLHFEYRIANIPVNPREWLDAKWIRDHVWQKIKAARKLVN